MIYAIGDSFTLGAELPESYWDTPGKGAWPEVLANYIGEPVINKGRSASGNTRIVKRAIDAVLNDATGIIICWTSPDRIEMIDQAGIFDIWPESSLSWLTENLETGHFEERKQHRSQLLKYLVIYHNEYDCFLYNYKNFLRQVILVQNLCKNYQIDCTMLIAFSAKEDVECFHNDNAVQNLLKGVDLNMFVDSTLEQSTRDWTRGTQNMPKGHPNSDGHVIIATKIWEHINNNWKYQKYENLGSWG